MEFGLGVLKWSPEQFWRATFYELSCAYIGHCRSTGAGKWARRPDGWTAASIEEHSAKIESLINNPPATPSPKELQKRLKAAWRDAEKLGLRCPKPSIN